MLLHPSKCGEHFLKGLAQREEVFCPLLYNQSPEAWYQYAVLLGNHKLHFHSILMESMSEILLSSLPAVLEILAGQVALGAQEGHSPLVVLGDPLGQYDPCGLGFQGLQAGPSHLVVLCHL